jgi:hypothetical protein
MREIWATPEHREKINATIAERLADPKELEAMRARCAAMRVSSSEKRSKGLAKVSWRRHASDKFASDEATTDWIVEQYKAGSSARQIALALGMAHSAVVYRLKKRGVATPKRGTGRRKIASSATYLARQGINDLHEFDRQVAVLHAEGNSINAIRNVYGLSADAIRNSLRRSQETSQ